MWLQAVLLYVVEDRGCPGLDGCLHSEAADDGLHRQLVQRHALPCQAQQVTQRGQPRADAASSALRHLWTFKHSMTL